MTDVQLYNRLPREVQKMVDRGDLDMPTIRRAMRAHQRRVRHEDHRDHTVDEVIDTTIEYYEFE